jgi:hypothetical protein
VCYVFQSKSSLFLLLLNLNNYFVNMLILNSCSDWKSKRPFYSGQTIFLQLSQNLMTNSLLIYAFCTSSEPKIVLQDLQIKTKTISQLIQNTYINKESIITNHSHFRWFSFSRKFSISMVSSQIRTLVLCLKENK